MKKLLIYLALAAAALGQTIISGTFIMNGTVSGSGGGGSGTPGGSNTQVQYNNAGSFGGITGATTDGTTLTLVAPILGAATADSLQAQQASAGILLKNNAGTTVASFGVGGSSSTNISLAGTVALGSNNLTMTGSIGATGARVTKLWATDLETTNAPVFGAPVTVANGGTGASTLTANNVILGNGTSAVQFVAPGTSGNVLTSNGTTWTSAAAAAGSTAWGSTVGFTTVASGSPDITAVTTNGITFSGTTALTGAALGTVTTGRAFQCVLSGAVPFTYNASSMQLPTGASFTGAVGDTFVLTSIGASQYRVSDYQKADGTPLAIGANFNYGTNPGNVVTQDSTITSASTIGTPHSYASRIDGTEVLKVYAESDGAGGIQNPGIFVNGGRLLTTLSAYGAGTAYAFTNTAAAIDLGTTDPSITITTAGTWKITACVQVTYTGATVVAETATLKLRRTNNTAADLTSSSITLDLPVSTTLTNTYGTVMLPAVYYTTVNSNDVVTIFANVSAALGAGTIDAAAGGTWIVAERLY